jgi:hypothetical protein
MTRFAMLILTIACTATASAADLKFKTHVLNPVFHSEGCTVGDYNKDGKIDVAAGDHWYEAPDWKKHEIRPPGQFDGTKGYSQSFVNGTMDVNQDGWADVIIVGFPGDPCHWYENPKNKPGHWKAHEIHNSTCNESPLVVDLDGDGRKDMVFASQPQAQMMWFSAPTSPGQTKWDAHPISKLKSPGTHKYAHGLGVGDVNQDGRLDVLIKEGWWEAPEDRRDPDWTFHPANFGEDCAHMYVYDFDDDGDMDVVSSSAHKYGIWWHEQGQAPDGKPTWTQHEIFMTVSQTHSMHFKDMDADGDPDLVTGKRFFAHQGNDPGGKEPVLLYWFEFARKAGKPTWTPHLINEGTGVGTQFEVADITGNGKYDIITSNKKGTHILENITK